MISPIVTRSEFLCPVCSQKFPSSTEASVCRNSHLANSELVIQMQGLYQDWVKADSVSAKLKVLSMIALLNGHDPAKAVIVDRKYKFRKIPERRHSLGLACSIAPYLQRCFTRKNVQAGEVVDDIHAPRVRIVDNSLLLDLADSAFYEEVRLRGSYFYNGPTRTYLLFRNNESNSNLIQAISLLESSSKSVSVLRSKARKLKLALSKSEYIEVEIKRHPELYEVDQRLISVQEELKSLQTLLRELRTEHGRLYAQAQRDQFVLDNPTTSSELEEVNQQLLIFSNQSKAVLDSAEHTEWLLKKGWDQWFLKRERN